jgi:hypothetical protein
MEFILDSILNIRRSKKSYIHIISDVGKKRVSFGGLISLLLFRYQEP